MAVEGLKITFDTLDAEAALDRLKEKLKDVAAAAQEARAAIVAISAAAPVIIGAGDGGSNG